MVASLHRDCVLSNLVQMMAIPIGVAGISPKSGQGLEIDLGGGSDPGLEVALAGKGGDASLIARIALDLSK